MPAELFANPPTPGGTTPWGLASLAASVGTTPAPGTVETWTLNQTPTGLSAQAGRFRFVIDNEICIDVTGASGTSRQVWRGAEGSTPATHAIGATLYHTVTAQALAPLGEVFHAVAYGVRANGKTVTDAVLTGNQLSSTSAAFTSADVGKLCVVVGAGTPASGTTSGSVTAGSITAIPVNALAAAIPPGGVILTDGTHTQQFVTSGALAGATSVPLIGAVVGGLSGSLSTGSATTTLPCAPLNFALSAGTVALSNVDATGTLHTQTFTTSGAAIGAASIPVTSLTPNFAYPESTMIFGSPLAQTASFTYASGSTVKTNVPALFTTISSVSGGVATLAASAGTNIASGGEVFYATDDTAALTACKTDAEAVNGTVILPEGDMGITAPIASTVAIAICGQSIKELFGATSQTNSGNWPSVAPYLKGSVLVQCSPFTDILQLTAQGVSQTVTDVGLRFAGKWQNTGHGLNTANTAFFGQVGGQFRDLKCYGVDGNHYGFVIDSAELMRWNGLRSYGGGGLWWKLHGQTGGRPGNTTCDDFYCCLFIAGIAQGVLMDSSVLASLGFDYSTFTELESCLRIPSPALPNTTPPINGGAQNMIQTFSSALFSQVAINGVGMESDATGQILTWPNGPGSYRTTNPGGVPSPTAIAQDKPTGGPASGSAYQNLHGKPLIVVFEALLQPTATGSPSTTTTSLFAVSSNATSIPVTSSTGFSVGQGVQIDTGVNAEYGIVASVPDGTHITIQLPGGLGLRVAHASGVAVAAGAAVVIAQISVANSFPATKVAYFASPIGDTARHVSFNFPLAVANWWRGDWANITRMNTVFADIS